MSSEIKREFEKAYRERFRELGHYELVVDKRAEWAAKWAFKKSIKTATDYRRYTDKAESTTNKIIYELEKMSKDLSG